MLRAHPVSGDMWGLSVLAGLPGFGALFALLAVLQQVAMALAAPAAFGVAANRAVGAVHQAVPAIDRPFETDAAKLSRPGREAGDARADWVCYRRMHAPFLPV